MKYLKIILVLAASLSLWGCAIIKKTPSKDVPYAITNGGIKYKLLKDAKGKQFAKEGDFVEIFIKTYFEDSLIFDSKQQTGNKPVAFPVSLPRFNGDLSEVFTLMTPGDSGIFMVSVDSMKANKQSVQPWMKDGSYINYAIKLVSIKTQEQVQAEKVEKAVAADTNPQQEEDALLKFLKKNNIVAQKRPSGLYYVITKPSDGEKPISGRTVKVNYTGKLMDGSVFDSNTGREPLSFVLGRGQVILGWDEGIALLKKGEKATLFIPSRLAYGENSPSPKIPPGSTLIFDVELVDF